MTEYNDSKASQIKNDERCREKPTRKPELYDYEDNSMHDIEEDYLIQEDYGEILNDVYRNPLFDGNALLSARIRLPANHFDISAEISAVCGNGTLISASGAKDYFWLGFINHRAVLRFDAGNGPLELRSGRVNTDRRSVISARRYKKDSVLRIGSTIARGSAQGKMSSLDVNPSVYVGRPPKNVTRLSGRRSTGGFVGCVHRLRINGRDLIPPARGLSVTSQGLHPCTPFNFGKLECL